MSTLFERVALGAIGYNRQEILSLPQNNAQHTIQFSIIDSAESLTNVVVEQRFGASVSDMTEWHPVANTRVNVKYRQKPYSVMVGASPTDYRELRLVSPVTLGLSVD